MSAKFYTLLTETGAAKLANAAALGVPLKITHMAVGSGGGVLPTPNAQQTALVAEERRAALNMLYIDPQNSSQIIAEQVIPENEGGWWIREVGLFDETGTLIAVGNCPESYKPKLAEGSGRTQTVRMVLITSGTDNITLKIDPAVVLATRKYVDDKVLELRVYVDDLMAKHIAASDPHTQYAPKASPTFTGTPKAPTAPAGNNSTQLANTAFVQAAIAALVDSSPGALDTLNELAKALGNDPNFATTMTNALAGKMDKADNGADIADVSTFLKNLGLGEIATLADIQAGTASKLVDAGGLKKFLPTKAMHASGYIRIPDVPGGTIIQWGQITGTINEGVQNVVLPTPFPNAGRFAIAIPLNLTADTTCDIFAQLQYASLTGISFFFSWVSSSTPANGFQWFAIGY
ncbi:phage tail protein [Salmonella enterica subsp. enterica]|nr:phage tail protein [Salmonella enterica subsp. enterica]